MEVRIALAGNPNSGKTTMYNALTGRNEKVGNWAGVTVGKKEHSIKKALCGEAAAPLAICPCPTLATDIERFFEAESPRALTDIILSIKRASSGVSGAACVCLGCTHYSIIKGVFARIFGVPVVDGNLGVANQLLRIIGSDPEFASSVKSFPQIITTAQSKINYQKVLSKLI